MGRAQGDEQELESAGTAADPVSQLRDWIDRAVPRGKVEAFALLNEIVEQAAADAQEIHLVCYADFPTIEVLSAWTSKEDADAACARAAAAAEARGSVWQKHGYYVETRPLNREDD